MRFLVDEDLPRSIGNLLRQYGHEAIDVRDIDLRGARDTEVAAYAQNQGLCLVTGDYGFSDVRNYPPGEYFGLVILHIPGKATASLIRNLLEGLLRQSKLISQLPGRLAIVEFGRVRIRKG